MTGRKESRKLVHIPLGNEKMNNRRKEDRKIKSLNEKKGKKRREDEKIYYKHQFKIDELCLR